ncbi:hypothetical protein Isop_1366 [Isosphaera pallida ATCC 43644]|uniref:Uncharacterized protein n=1 Tax=Isosphaera pallida (strain ATCC 43644 / DSM 9630 / IS1B) TaxID=575540 RepID=E8QXB0_ISOPI|nr:hypothetical protein Isop_1366 [Isosphaera pallida ATCC 43644]
MERDPIEIKVRGVGRRREAKVPLVPYDPRIVGTVGSGSARVAPIPGGVNEGPRRISLVSSLLFLVYVLIPASVGSGVGVV